MSAASAKRKSLAKSTVAANKAIVDKQSKPVSGKRPRSRQRSAGPANQRASSSAVDTLKENIRVAQKRIGQHKEGIVVGLIVIGQNLMSIRKEEPDRWLEHLKDLGIKDRMARRYMQIASIWDGRIGINDTGVLEHLPADVLKLVSLSRLSADEFGGLIKTVNLRKTKREDVVAAVNQICGTEKPENPKRAFAHANLVSNGKTKLRTDDDGNREDVEDADEDEGGDHNDEGDDGDKSEPQRNPTEKKPRSEIGNDPEYMVRRFIQGAMFMSNSLDDDQKTAQIRRQLLSQSTELRPSLNRVLAWAMSVIQEAGAKK
jgi:hypothetical protein